MAFYQKVLRGIKNSLKDIYLEAKLYQFHLTHYEIQQLSIQSTYCPLI